jgi:hypothetical protein
MELVILHKKKLNTLFVKNLIIIAVLILAIDMQGQQNRKVPKDFCISEDENRLFESINLFIVENGGKSLSLSKSLSYVARTHINDLSQNRPDTSVCNLSSWSDKGNWTACCYNPYILDPDCMWDKPKQITEFRYRGYELALYFEEEFNSDTVMLMLYSSKFALDMLLTKGEYSSKKWDCMGVGINNNYSSIWFAQRPDNAGKPKVCVDSDQSTEEVLTIKTNKYYIIASSFGDMKDAKEALKRLKQNGFSDAGILKTGPNIRIYINEFATLKEAMYLKQKLPYTYNDAWIFK